MPLSEVEYSPAPEKSNPDASYVPLPVRLPACLRKSSDFNEVKGILMLHLDTGNTGFMLLCTSLVMLMTPGLAFFYAARRPQKCCLPS